MFLRLLLLLLLLFCSVIDASKPALILIPGAFHRASVYDVVKSQLGDVGYDQIDAVDLPSLGYEAADIERTADVEVVANLLLKRLKTGSDVILVGNSYGATVIMEAVKHFEAYSTISAHPRSSTSGHILGLIMLSGYIPTIAEVTHNPPRPDIRQIGAPFFAYHPPDNNNHPTLVTWDRDLAAYPPALTFYNLLNASAAEYWSSRLLPTSFKALNATGTYIPYDGRFRVLYVVGREDRCVTEEFARGRYLGQEGARFEVEVLGGDHVMMLSRPEEVVGVVRRFAGERVGEDEDEDEGRVEL